MLDRFQQHLSQLYPLETDRIVNEITAGFNEELHLSYLFILAFIEIMLLKKLGHRYQLTGDFVLDQITGKLDSHVKENQKDEIIDKNNIIKKVIFPITYVAFLAPIDEEFVFRGLVTPMLKTGLSYLGMSESLAPIMSSIMFGIAHPFPKKLAMFAAGLYSEDITKNNNGSLWSSTANHMKNNVLAIIGPIFIVAALLLTAMVITYLIKHGKALENQLSKKSDLSSKAILGAFHGGLWSLLALPSIYLIDKLAPNFPCEMPLPAKMASTIIFGSVAGTVRSGLHFFSGKKSTPLKTNDATSTQCQKNIGLR